MSAAPDILYTEHSPPGWIAARGAAALADLRNHGLPHRRVEDWKYSDLRDALNARAISSAPTAEAAFGGLHAATLTLRDGAVSGCAALPPIFEAVDLAQEGAPDWVKAHLGKLISEGMAGAALALMRGGVAIRVPSGVIAEAPLHLDFVSTEAHHACVLLLLEEGASLTLLESHRHAAQLANAAMEIVLGSGAKLNHVRFAGSAADVVQVTTLGVTLKAKSAYRAHYADLGARLSRLELHLALTGSGAECELSGVQVLENGRHSDVTTRLEHAHGEAASVQIFKQIVAAESRAAYQGRVTVAEGADGTDSRQSAKALLLAQSAEADLKPELVIFAEDVQCAHGAAVGDLDPDQLFYLRARGIPEREARALLMRAFVEDVLALVPAEPVRAALWSRLDDVLSRLGGGA